MTNETVLEDFKVLETGSSFISNNFQMLQKHFPDEYIAVEDNKVIADASSFEELSNKLQLKKKQLNEVIIEFIPRAGVIVLY